MRVGTFPLGASQFGILDLSGNALGVDSRQADEVR
jgi:hypothetical protein